MKYSSLKENQTRNSILCESYILSELESFDEVIKVYHDLKQKHQGNTVIFTLDDLDQAEYTCTHAMMSNELDRTEGFDLSNVDSAAFEDGEHIGYLSTQSEFFIIKENFERMIQGIDFSHACDKELMLEEGELETLENINKDPFDFIDEYVIMKVVPVDESYKAVCGFPNGYFSCDLNPSENYALVKHLYEQYNYELMGIGASLIGFIREEVLKEGEEKQLMDDLSKLYHYDGVKINSIKGSKYLFLKYTESVDHLD